MDKLDKLEEIETRLRRLEVAMGRIAEKFERLMKVAERLPLDTLLAQFMKKKE